MDDVEFPKAFSSYGKKYRRYKNQQKKEPRGIYGIIMENINTKQYLLVKGRESGKYSFPKGHIEPDETPVECIFRELYEETGIRLLFNFEKVRMRDLVKSKIGTYLHCEVTQNIATDAKDIREIEEVGWYSIDQLKHMNLNADAGYYLKGMGIL